MKEVKLPSGAVLKIGEAPFKDARHLYQTMFAELGSLPISAKSDVVELYRELFCKGMASKAIEAALWKCFERCSYSVGKGDLKISEDTFEPVEARQDYWTVCIEVAKENISPFPKSLYAEYGALFRQVLNVQQ